MFKSRMAGWLGGGKSKGASKYLLEVEVLDAEGLPNWVRSCRIVWARSSKVKATDVHPAKHGKVTHFE